VGCTEPYILVFSVPSYHLRAMQDGSGRAREGAGVVKGKP
jgi:hypothetical protein